MGTKKLHQQQEADAKEPFDASASAARLVFLSVHQHSQQNYNTFDNLLVKAGYV